MNTYRLPAYNLLFQFHVIAVKPQTRTARNASSGTNCCVRLFRPESPSNHKNVQTAASVIACYVHLHITIKHKHVQTARTVTTCCVSMPRHHRQTTNTYRMPAYNLLCLNAASSPSNYKHVQHGMPAQLQIAVFNAPSSVTIKHKHVQTASLVTTCCVQCPICHRQSTNM